MCFKIYNTPLQPLILRVLVRSPNQSNVDFFPIIFSSSCLACLSEEVDTAATSVKLAVVFVFWLGQLLICRSGFLLAFLGLLVGIEKGAAGIAVGGVQEEEC